jgi:glucose-6-phosphate-specific signal transduction histidine kinase
MLAYAEASATGNDRDPALAGLCIRVSDDGQGLPPDVTPGMGLLGMRERVRALGGAVALGNALNSGAVVEALFDAPGTQSQIHGNARPTFSVGGETV